MKYLYAVLIAAVVMGLIILGPMTLIWSLNTIAEQAALGWYIPHNFWTYFAGTILIVLTNALNVTITW